MGCTNVLASPRNKSIDASIRFVGAPPGGEPPAVFPGALYIPSRFC